MTYERLLIPCILAIALGLLIYFPIPGVNHDIVLSIVAGLLGALTNRSEKPPGDVTPPDSDPQS